MRSQDYPIDLEKLDSYWQSFMTQGKGSYLDKCDPLIVESWARCLLQHDPYSAPQISKAKDSTLQTVLSIQSDWLTVATPYLEDLQEQMGGAAQILLLSDRTGCLLFVLRQSGVNDIVQFPEFDVGSYWVESQMGTNALGLALITAMPTQVIGAEHFFQTHHNLASSAAPLHNQEGRLIGVVGMIGSVKTADPRDLAFVTSTAHAITNLLQSNQLFDDSNQRLTEVNAILETITDGILMWGALGRIKFCNSQVAKMFGVSAAFLSGKFIEEVIEFQPQIRVALEQAQIINNIETIVQIKNRRIPCLITLKSVALEQHSTIGWMALLQPITQVRQIAQQQFGARAFFTLDDFVSQSPTMKKIIQQARTVAKGTAPILLQGEGGVGKKRLAQAIHNSGPRARKPFILFNCRAIPRELIMHELLGNENQNESAGRPSKFELADGGTLVIESIEDMPLELQEVLLSLLDIRHFSRLGGIRMIPVNVRIVATSRADLSQRVKEKSFSSQLYYRLNVFRFEVPPLRKRTSDIPDIVKRFLAVRRVGQADVVQIEPLALEILKQYPWPGNVRELENVLERALSHAVEGHIRIADLPDAVRQRRVLALDDPDPQPVMTLKEAEKEAILKAGWACKGGVSKMAEILDIGRTTLWRKMRELNITPEQFK